MRRLLYLISTILLFTACSTTKNIPDDDQLFIGLTKIDYQNHDKSDNFLETQEEVEAALATAPNGALFGSSYYRTPFPIKLWIWNACQGKDDALSKWAEKNFSKPPVLMSWVNPALRASVAQSVLRAHGYFHGKVDYDIVQQRNPKKAKIGYTVNMGHLFTVDTMRYVNFPASTDSLIAATADDALIRTGTPFTVSALDAERSRITTLLRNHGYYYYQPNYASYLADTLKVPGKAQLRLQMADGVPASATRQWYIGNITIDMRKTFMQQMTDSLGRGFFKVRFSGKRPPIRLGVIMRDMKLRHGDYYSYDAYIETANKLNATGVFSMTDFSFTPRDTTATCDTLDLLLSCTFEKPYDFYIETNVNNTTTGRVGPELVLGLTKRNAFRGGELLDINLHGSYEWQRLGGVKGSQRVNSYEYGVDASIKFPRLLLPWREFFRSRTRRSANARNRRPMTHYVQTPSTILRISRNALFRPDYFKMISASGELTYTWQKTATSRHELSPLTFTYQYLSNKTDTFLNILANNPYLSTTMQDVFIPKIRYVYSYSSPASMRNPIKWEISVSESGNLLSLGYMAAGNKWSTVRKKLFNNSYAQFVKLETDFTKSWHLGNHSELVGHVNGGVIYSYGNSERPPYSEQFYVGGANSIRAFTVRSIGPGRYTSPSYAWSFMDQVGDIKLQMNLEYRARLFGSVHGAVFLDAGNVWSTETDTRENSVFKVKNILREMAVGTGVGLRYDLDFLVLRLDWGIGLHVPYETGKNGFYNIPRFKDGQALHLAVGYPF
ncbi:MAG: BamA/TamA family outer membrane protein [Prevotella sp.]|nr:BamA/TamA family outer membrane protein [Prevotella sp.]